MSEQDTTRRPLHVDRSLLQLSVLGAARDVTGSLNLFQYRDKHRTVRFLVDAGLHQGKEARNYENRLPEGLTAADIDFVIVSHAHIDHSGYLPCLVKAGFTGPVYCTDATKDLIEFLLIDSGRLQAAAARDARKLLRKLQSGQSIPAAQRPEEHELSPLYSETDARRCLSQIKTLKLDRTYQLADGVSVKLTEACHILGAAVVTMEIGRQGTKKQSFCFSGNIGRPDMAVLRDLAPVAECDFLMCESTYGDKLHDKRNRLKALAKIINAAYARARVADGNHGLGAIVIPAFAVGRVQAVLFDLRQLMAERRIPSIPVFVDSPMANRSTAVHRRHPELYNAEAKRLVSMGIDPFATPRYIECERETPAVLTRPLKEPVIIIGSGGMCTGGKILRHVIRRLPSNNSTVLLVGHQEPGTPGYELVQHKSGRIRMDDRRITRRATIEYMPDYSGHADYEDILRWMRQFRRPPMTTFLVHGEPTALNALKARIENELGWNVVIPDHRQRFTLSA